MVFSVFANRLLFKTDKPSYTFLELICLDSLILIIFLDLAEITFSDKLDLGVQDDHISLHNFVKHMLKQKNLKIKSKQ